MQCLYDNHAMQTSLLLQQRCFQILHLNSMMLGDSYLVFSPSEGRYLRCLCIVCVPFAEQASLVIQLMLVP